MDKQTSLFAPKQMTKYAPVLLGVLLFGIVSVLVVRAYYPDTADTTIQELNASRVRLETELKSKLEEQDQINKDLQSINEVVNTLRTEREDLTKKIDSTINPNYKPEIAEKK